jgi:predicted PurR-regulated permease PerM
MPKIWVKKSGKFNERVQKNGCKAKFLVFFIAVLSALGLWILGLPLILTLALIAGYPTLFPTSDL